MNQSPPTARSECQLVERYLTGLGHQSVQTAHLPFPEPPETAFQRAKRYSRAIAKHGVGPRKFRARIVCAALKEGLRG